MLRQDELQERHAQMIAFQRQIAPFTPTQRELMDLWRLNSTSAVKYILEKFVELGWCVSRDSGNIYTRYYAVETKPVPVYDTAQPIPEAV